MMNVWRFAILFPCVMAMAFAHGGLILAERGKAPDYVIVIPAAASEAVRYAAEELRDFTEKTTDVRLEIATDVGSMPPKAIVLSVADEPDENDGFRLKVEDGRLRVVGGNERGVLYGVYELLERYAGCRWYAS